MVTTVYERENCADVSYFLCFTRKAKEIGDVCEQAKGFAVGKTSAVKRKVRKFFEFCSKVS